MSKKIKELVTKGTVKVPVIMQLEATECGAASLAMVMAYFDKWLPLERTRQDCGVSRDGSSAKNILLAARSYGMEAHTFSADVDSIKEEGPFLCIIHWGFNHFVVLDGFRGGKAYLNDPARGFVKVSMEEFDRNYTGVLIVLEPGKKVAFVGASGCGKSTLAKLISGLYQPWSGEILFDGKPISQIDHNTFTGSVSVVDQDVIMFDDSIANNVKMWNTSIEDFEMILATRDACIYEDVMLREKGFSHRLMENGKDFSGGQRQRLEIARALAQEPTILIMDEATSALDAKTEYEVVKRITDRGITCVVIAHRLSTIRQCDRILLLKDGKLVEDGSYDELIEKNGMFADLVRRQMVIP